ncbi:MAG: hypothetical protein AAB652_02040 [Patescibacteria group bacterium]
MDGKKELVARLTEAKLPTDPREILDRKFLFFTDNGSHYEILIGTITGIRLTKDGGLELHATTLPAHGNHRDTLKFLGPSWTLSAPELSFPRLLRIGDFELLDGDWPMNFV